MPNGTPARGLSTPLAAVFRDEGVSGSTGLDKRLGLLAAIAALKKGDLLLVAKRDRLGRDPLVVAMIEGAVQRKGAQYGRPSFQPSTRQEKPFRTRTKRRHPWKTT